MRSFQAGLRASGKSSTATIRPTRMSTLAKSSKVMVSLMSVRALGALRALGAEAEGPQRRLQAAVVADVVGAHDRRGARRRCPDVGADARGHVRQQQDPAAVHQRAVGAAVLED